MQCHCQLWGFDTNSITRFFVIIADVFPIFFHIVGKPKIRKALKDVEVNEGETLTLEIEVYAVPEPKIVWYKDGQEVRADARIKIQRDSQRLETYNLTLNLIKREESGLYEVKATNNLGSASTKSQVTVLSK